jgi:hypothetical protein
MKTNNNFQNGKINNNQGTLVKVNNTKLLTMLLVNANKYIKNDVLNLTGVSYLTAFSPSDLKAILESEDYLQKSRIFNLGKIRIYIIVNDDLEFQKEIIENNGICVAEFWRIHISALASTEFLNDSLNNYANGLEYVNNLFYFQNEKWHDLEEIFSKNNIKLSAGSNTRRQFLSPLEHKFSIILNCLGITLDNIITSFWMQNKIISENKKAKRILSKKENSINDDNQDQNNQEDKINNKNNLARNSKN